MADGLLARAQLSAPSLVLKWKFSAEFKIVTSWFRLECSSRAAFFRSVCGRERSRVLKRPECYSKGLKVTFELPYFITLEPNSQDLRRLCPNQIPHSDSHDKHVRRITSDNCVLQCTHQITLLSIFAFDHEYRSCSSDSSKLMRK